MSAAAHEGDDDPRADHLASMLYSAAVFELATSDEPLRDRIASAYLQHAVLVDHLLGSLPPPVAEHIGRLQMTLGQQDAVAGVPEPGSLRQALADLGDDEVRSVARAVCFIAEDLLNSSDHPAPDDRPDSVRSVRAAAPGTEPEPPRRIARRAHRRVALRRPGARSPGPRPDEP
jgi:hypothetical protein